MSTTDDTRQRSVGELMGWQRADGYDDRWVRPASGVAYLEGSGHTPDDMLRWLADRCESVETWTNYVGEDLCHRVTVWDDGERPVPEITRPTLHAALEAAVRAVAEVTDG